MSWDTCPKCGGRKANRAVLCHDCRYPNKGSADRPMPLNGREASEYGCTCTFENAGGKTLTICRVGPPVKGLKEACVLVSALDETFRLVSYSTPTTIYQDMQGDRLGGSRISDEVTGSDRSTALEAHVLSRAGFLHMLHPRLAA